MSERMRTAEEIRADVARLADELDRRLDEHEATAAADEWSRRARLLRLEAAYLLSRDAPERDGQGRSAGAVFRGLGEFLLKAAPVATSVWVALVAYFVNDKVEQALDVRRVEVAEAQLDLDTIKAIEAKLSQLRDAGSAEEAEKVAMQIAAFGSGALLPLVMELDLDANLDEKRADALNHALRMMALVGYQRSRLCDTLGEAIRIDVFQRDGKKMMAALSEDLSCPGATGAGADGAAGTE